MRIEYFAGHNNLLDTVMCWTLLSFGHSEVLDTPLYDKISDNFDPHYPQN